MDQERLVVMSRPSSVSATSSASERGPLGSGSSDTLVMRMMAGRLQDSARMQPPERPKKRRAAISRDDR